MTKLVRMHPSNASVLANLAQAYEAEFSKITLKMPDPSGLFPLDTLPEAPYVGYLFYQKEIPIGFCIVDVESAIRDIGEFYIVPAMRGRKLGAQLAFAIFDAYPGEWRVRQIEGADEATRFWRIVIKQYTHNTYDESAVKDEHWGVVTCQRFKSPPKV
jgi:predicted acetyltransferase